MMNTSGGLILVSGEGPHSDKEWDNWFNGFYACLTNWIPKTLLESHVTPRHGNPDTSSQLGIDYVYLFVMDSPTLVTYHFHAYRRLAASVAPIICPHVVQEMLSQSSDSSASGGECSSQLAATFKLDETIKLKENYDMEFKHVKTHDLENKSNKPTYLLNKYSDNFSAFANTHGGSLVLGVEEKKGTGNIARGFPVTQSQEAAITEHLTKQLERCIWHGNKDYKPVKGRDWDVFYHKVIGEDHEDGRERKMIEVRIAKHSGGMFMRIPECWVLDKNGELQEKYSVQDKNDDLEKKKKFEEWMKDMQTNTSGMGNKDIQTLENHVERAEPERNEQEVPDSLAPNTPEDQSRWVSAAVAPKSELPESFKESVSEHKSDIKVWCLNILDCCRINMAEHIQKCPGDSFEYTREQLSDVEQLSDFVWSKKVMEFLQTKVGNGVVCVIKIDESYNTTNEHPPLPSGYTVLCHVVAIREDKPPLLMCCIHNDSHWELTGEDRRERLVDYSLDRGCALKRQFLMCTANKLHPAYFFYLDVKIVLVSTEGDVETVWNSKNTRSVDYPNSDTKVQNTIACIGLAGEFLKTTASLKNGYGQKLIDHLTAGQAKVLLGKPERVLLVNGKSGTGKTVIALHLMVEAIEGGCMKENVVYICSNEGLKTFVSSQVSCQSIVIKKTNSLTQSQKTMLEKAKLIIVDDAQAIELDEQWETKGNDLYWTLFTHPSRLDARVTVLFDAEQDYMKHLPPDFATRLRNLAEKTFKPHEIKIPAPLTERIRNGQEIVRFIQAIHNQAKTHEKMECLSERPGDDVLYQYIGSSIEVSGKKLNDKLDELGEKYEARSIAIVSHDTVLVNEMKDALKNFGKKFQEDNKYPIEHTVMCSLEEFCGLEAEVILYLWPRNFGPPEIKVPWKYLNMISSRARERLEFLLAWDPALERGGDKLADLLELFKTVRAIKYI